MKYEGDGIEFDLLSRDDFVDGWEAMGYDDNKKSMTDVEFICGSIMGSAIAIQTTMLFGITQICKAIRENKK